MEWINVIAAAVGAFVWGAIWYGVLGNQWMAASGVPVKDGKPANQSNPINYIVALLACIVVAGMMRHVFAGGGVEGLGRGAIYGAGLGLFIACPWLVTCYGFADRPRSLALIDSGYVIGGCAAIGLILNLF